MPLPNILWLCTDQQRFDTLGCYGNAFVRTPNVDRLAEEGVLFENAFSQSPVCTPSRACFLSGRYPRTTRARQNGQNIPEEEKLLPRILRDYGYVSGLSGKLHLSVCSPQACPDTERRIDDGYDTFHWSHHPKPDWPTSEYGLWLEESGVPYQTPPHPESGQIRVGMPTSHHQTTWCAQKAINFIEAHSDFENPWLFSFNCFDPHNAFDPPAEYLERYLENLDAIPLPNYSEGEEANKPRYQHPEYRMKYSQGGHPHEQLSDKDHRLIRAAYWAMCDLIDDQVGRILEALDRTGQRENTLIIFMSDHGELLGDHGIYLKGPYFYECSIHVPLILSWPGTIPPGRRSCALVELADIPPTLLEAGGLEPQPGMQGRSFWPLLAGEQDLSHHREDIYCEYYNSMRSRIDPHAYATMVRTDRYKLVVAHGLDTGELYDLEKDPAETHNLWDTAERQSLKLEMMKRLCDRMAWTVDPLPARLGPF